MKLQKSVKMTLSSMRVAAIRRDRVGNLQEQHNKD